MNKAQEFLQIAGQFRLGHLTTEGVHHLTTEMSELAKNDLAQGINVLQAVDRLALRSLQLKAPEIWQLHQRVKSTFESGHDVLLVGCGATGRLSLVIETLSRQLGLYPGRVRAFMAGGDYALVKSVESFEDRTHYGARQLHDLGFKNGDLLLAITEGGETPFVIGACNEAEKISMEKPWFLYCNPDAALEGLQRCREVLENPRIQKLNLTCGPMALTGSTRMQASTVQMAAAGLAVLYMWENEAQMSDALSQWAEWYGELDLTGLAPFIEAEASAKVTTYVSDAQLAISILTDTTERSPTFSQPAFENIQETSTLSPIYLAVKGTFCAREAWETLLSRSPRCLTWEELQGRISEEVLGGFDISENARKRRAGAEVSFTQRPGQVLWERTGASWSMPLWDASPLFTHLTLKMALNTLSTLMMGRRGFYQDNVMVWVRPSNNKLIDRATRYVQFLAKRRGVDVSYERGVELVLTEMDKELEGPVVVRVLRELGIKL
jgi:N-acetylmuramic acid 6-phosphate etherase